VAEIFSGADRPRGNTRGVGRPVQSARMDHFSYSQEGRLLVEGLDVGALADRFGTPLYVYSGATFRHHAARLREAFAPVRAEMHFAVKACHNVHILRLLVGEGLGMDVVSGGELARAQAAGCPMERVSFAGVGKTETEIEAGLRGRIAHFNVESGEELGRLVNVAARLGVVARYCLRINPNVDARTHKYTTTGKDENKFGVDPDTAMSLVARFAGVKSARFAGFHVHLGSPIYSTEPYEAMLGVMLGLVARAESLGHRVEVLNLGGGFGADYVTGRTPTAADFARVMVPPLMPLVSRAEPVRIVLEPGRFIAANAGILVTTVQYVKAGRARTFAIADAGMQTLIRPALYEAFHFVWPIAVEPGMVPNVRAERVDLPGLVKYDVVGPVCESGDFLAQGREMPRVKAGDRLAVFTAGAYGMTMTSTYNDQPRPAEVLADGGAARLIRRRETIAELLAQEEGL
jgi:diaminopimelate decarboxylase